MNVWGLIHPPKILAVAAVGLAIVSPGYAQSVAPPAPISMDFQLVPFGGGTAPPQAQSEPSTAAATVPVAFDPATGQNVELTAGALASCIAAGGCDDLINYYVRFPDPVTGRPDGRRKAALAAALATKVEPGVAAPEIASAYSRLGLPRSSRQARQGVSPDPYSNPELKTLIRNSVSTYVEMPSGIGSVFGGLPVQLVTANRDDCVSGDTLGCEAYTYYMLSTRAPDRRNKLIADIATATLTGADQSTPEAIGRTAAILGVIANASPNSQQRQTVAEVATTLLSNAGLETGSINVSPQRVLTQSQSPTLQSPQEGLAGGNPTLTTQSVAVSPPASPN